MGAVPREGGKPPLVEGAFVAARLWPASLAASLWRRAAPALRPPRPRRGLLGSRGSEGRFTSLKYSNSASSMSLPSAGTAKEGGKPPPLVEGALGGGPLVAGLLRRPAL